MNGTAYSIWILYLIFLIPTTALAVVSLVLANSWELAVGCVGTGFGLCMFARLTLYLGKIEVKWSKYEYQ